MYNFGVKFGKARMCWKLGFEIQEEKVIVINRKLQQLWPNTHYMYCMTLKSRSKR